MMALSVMIIDDEPLAIERLEDLLNRLGGVEVTGSFLNASDALASVEMHRPDLILVDVEMPKIDGFDFVEALAKHPWQKAANPPCICFVTAYPQFACDAFDSGALDFLCKPLRLSRLEKTIERARRTISQQRAAAELEILNSKLDELRKSQHSPIEPSLWVHERGQMMRVQIETIDWIQAEGEYVRLHVRGQSFLLRSSIGSLADRLRQMGFIRIHRSTVINQSRLSSLRGNRSGTTALLENGVALAVGRKYRRIVREQQREI
jgi:DNA-binding LytR/AlgR family response regulator